MITLQILDLKDGGIKKVSQNPLKHDFFHICYLDLIKITYIAVDMQNTCYNMMMCCCYPKNRKGIVLS
jgi:hypothetical protein